MDELASTSELRDEIADIDGQIIDLIALRVDMTDELARAKRRSSQDYWDAGNAERITERYRTLCSEVNLTKEEAEQIAKVILTISKERQKKIYDSTSEK